MSRKVVKKRGRLVLILIILLCIISLAVAFGKNIFNKEDVSEGETDNNMTNEESAEEILMHAIVLEDGTKLNTSEELNKTKKYKNLEISNIQFTSKDGSSVLLADVKNVGTEEHAAEIVKITILDDNNEVIAEIAPIIDKVKPGETIKLNAMVTADIVDAKNIKIEEKK